MSPTSTPAVRCRLLRAVAVTAAAMMVIGCTYAADEPGLFERTTPTPAGSRSSTQTPPQAPPTNPALPVLTEAVWTSADGFDVQARLAVHAVRRISGATVLDWSVTPLRAPNLRPGDRVPTLDLGLSRPDDELPRVYLLDSARRRLYRPLTSAADPARCVCTPLAAAQRDLRLGHTSLLQVAFPALPAATATVDVLIASVTPFGQVPVTPTGRLPVAVAPVELGRPPDSGPRADRFTEMFRYGPEQQVFRIQVNRVLASSSFTGLEWTIWSVTGGPGLESATDPPFVKADTRGLGAATTASASGAVLVVDTTEGRRTLSTWLVGSDDDPGALECLCTSLTGWTPLLRRPDKPVTVVTTYPPLPARAEVVGVRFDGLGEVVVPVSTASDARRRMSGVRPWSPTTWRSAELRSGPGWTTGDWPTPVPASDQLPEMRPAPSVLVR